MKMKPIAGVLGGLMLLFLAGSFTSVNVPAKFTPVGTWEYHVPGVDPGYDRGVMVITEIEKEIQVNIGPSKDYLSPVQDVEYKNKSLSFKVYVEYEEVVVKGDFDGDSFAGTVSFSGGTFDMKAQRVAENQ